jgi:DNA-binding transcriptional MocR family regulator
MVAQFAIIPDYLLTEASPAALRVYMALALRVDHKTGLCWPSRASIARTLDVSLNTVDRALRSLEQLGAIETSHRLNDAGDWTSNIYRLPFAITRRVPPPMGTPLPTHGPTGTPTHGETVPPPVGDYLYSSDLEPIDPEDLLKQTPPRADKEPWAKYLARLARGDDTTKEQN